MTLIDEEDKPRKLQEKIWANNRNEVIGYLKDGYGHSPQSSGNSGLLMLWLLWFLSLGACTFFAASGLSTAAGLWPYSL